MVVTRAGKGSKIYFLIMKAGFLLIKVLRGKRFFLSLFEGILKNIIIKIVGGPWTRLGGILADSLYRTKGIGGF
ncbi:MAG: hypothetical protein BTN85_2050 [Candidatus Methanohalarchaeum thermophilum]|uniref:Uncharacterized protein n=1 Tax=Methanohalarchaeum thermophilum TaxID=1903181 RepID=A0A1Q6DSP7_METT1|nr:MAG: hypothetical protein BTN85_2050 [Candidatus Methanohalarchaeum thermophilum]